MGITRYPDDVEDVLDPLLRFSERVILETFGDTVSVFAKSKQLNNFGVTNNADSDVRTTVAQFPGAVVNETFVSTNAIDRIVSSNAGDTQTCTLEGHTIDGSGNLTFVTQSVTLNGQTPVTLGTPLARANQWFIAPSGTFNSPQATTLGNISIYDSSATTVTAGTPNTAASVKLYIPAGLPQSRKCATTISSTDYWIITELLCSVRKGSSGARVEAQIETRDVFNGGVWRPNGAEIVCTGDTGTLTEEFFPPLIVPKNHDVRLVATSDTNNTTVNGDIQGYLALVTSSA